MAKQSRGIKSSRLHQGRRTSTQPATFAKRVILIIIFLAAITVVTAIAISTFFNKPNLVKSRIESIASDYYENYYHPRLINSRQFKQLSDLDKAMQKYHEKGFTPISLNELLTYDNNNYSADRDYLTSYCNPKSTAVVFYPDSPYDAKSYHLNITYSCNF